MWLQRLFGLIGVDTGTFVATVFLVCYFHYLSYWQRVHSQGTNDALSSTEGKAYNGLICLFILGS